MHFKIKIYRNVQLSLLFVQFYMTLGLFLILYIVFSFLWETLLSLNNRNSLSATLDSYKLCADQQQSCVSMKLFAFSPFWLKFLVDNYFLKCLHSLWKYPWSSCWNDPFSSTSTCTFLLTFIHYCNSKIIPATFKFTLW